MFEIILFNDQLKLLFINAGGVARVGELDCFQASITKPNGVIPLGIYSSESAAKLAAKQALDFVKLPYKTQKGGHKHFHLKSPPSNHHVI